MVDNEEYQELKVSHVSEQDVYKGWVRINKDDRKGYSRKDMVIIEVKDKKSKLIRKVLGTDKKNCILMDFDTRFNDKKWNLKPDESHEFKITKIKRCRLDKILPYYLNHPDVAIKISSWFSIISIAIAFISLIIAIFF